MPRKGDTLTIVDHSACTPGLRSGEIFADRYEVIEELGRGGMGCVYKVFDQATKDYIALKLIRPEIAANNQIIERFQAELRLTRQISHRNVCRMYDLNFFDGSPYLTMEYVNGESLRNMIRMIGTFSPGQIIYIGKQICEGLKEAHRLNVVHRDLKPDNIIVDMDGTAKIMDFGIARALNVPGITRADNVVGTPLYMSPEQFEGRKVDGRTDIYSLGVMLYEMAAGRVPFDGDTCVSLAVKHKTEIPEDPRRLNADIPDNLSRLILKCLEKNREDRFATVEELLSKLSSIEANIPARERKLDQERLASFPKLHRKTLLGTLPKKLKENKQARTVAAFIGSGAILWEFAHHILVNHYNFPKQTVDITLITLFGVLCITLIAQSFHLKTDRFKPLPLLLIAAALIGTVVADSYFIVKIKDNGHSSLSQMKNKMSIAVLPFTILGGDAEAETSCIGLVHYFSSKLSALEQFKDALDVIPASEVLDNNIDSTEKARHEFGVNLVITETIQWIGEEMILTLNLVDAGALRQIRSDIVSVPSGSYPDLLKESLPKLVGLLEIELSPSIQRFLTDGGTTVREALEAYIQGIGRLSSYQDINEVESAIALFKRSLAADQVYVEAWAALGEAYWRKWELTKDQACVESARSACEKALELNDRLPPVLVTLGLLNRGTGHYEQAVQNLQDALRLNPVDYDANKELALTYQNMGRLEGAEAAYKTAIRCKPSYWSGYSHLGFFYYQFGRYEEATEMFREVVALVPNNMIAYSNLAASYSQMGRDDKAIDTLKAALKMKPDEIVLANLGTIYFFDKRYGEARKLYETALETDLGTKNSLIWGNLGDACRYTGDPDEAAEAYRKASTLVEKELEINARDPFLHAYLAYLLIVQHETERGISEIANALEMDSNRLDVLDIAVLAYELAGMRDKAVEALIDFVQKDGPLENLRKHPDLSGLREDPRVEPLLEPTE